MQATHQILIEVTWRKEEIMEYKIPLDQSIFYPDDTVLVEGGGLRASSFVYPSGVKAVRLCHQNAAVIMLPYQGQQIWSAVFSGRELGMRSMFSEPQAERDVLRNLARYMLHCGVTGIGAPGPQDQHALHGELPNAPYQHAWLVAGEDKAGSYIGLSGSYEFIEVFNAHYRFTPLVKLYQGSTLLQVQVTLENLNQTPLEYLYLAHINLRPVDYGRLVYSTAVNPANVRVRADLPPTMQVKPGYREFVQQLAEHPELHHIFSPGMPYDPEVVFYIKFLADDQGWASSMQVHPDGSADIVRHKPGQLSHGVRWICRTANQEGLGFEPATAEVEGFTAEKAKGNVRVLAPGEIFRADYQIGLLSPEEAAAEREKISALTGFAW
jgi:hypothetical protein